MRFTVIVLLVLLSVPAVAQTDATQDLDEKYDGAFKLFFYKSTLRMLDHENTREYYDMVKDIEKAKLLNITKYDSIDYSSNYKAYISGIKDEGFESVMNIRHDGDNVDIYIHEEEGETLGMILLMNNKESIFILDIEGSIDLTRVSDLLSLVNNNEDLLNFKFD